MFSPFIFIRRASWTMSSVIRSSEINWSVFESFFTADKVDVKSSRSVLLCIPYEGLSRNNGHGMRGFSWLSQAFPELVELNSGSSLIFMAIFSSHHELTLPRIMQTQSSGNRSVLPVNATCFICQCLIAGWLKIQLLGFSSLSLSGSVVLDSEESQYNGQS